MKYLVAGLGNPGKKYIGTRHNVGFAVVNWLAKQWGAADFTMSSHGKAATTEAMTAGQKILLVKPQTFMNSSGEAVKALTDYYDVAPENVLIIYDDVDLPLPELRLAHDRGSGGHRGLQSVISQLGTKDFYRLRVGISPTDDEGNLDKQTVPGKGINPFVMSQFSSEELSQLESVYPELQTAIEKWVEAGRETAMNYLN